jgi:hypothetical protein
MKKYLLSILILILSSPFVYAHVKHYDKFNYLEYDLFRNDKLIGFHKYNFERNLDNLKVKSIVEFKITKLGVNLYNYIAESEEIYKDGFFHSFKSKTKQNKKDKYVNISIKDKKDLLIDGSSFKGEGSRNFIVGTWWNHEIIKKKAQISAISGRIIFQNVEFLGKEVIKIGEKDYNSLHFRFTSSDKNLPDKKKLDTHIWYEEDSFLWLKAAFDKTGYWEYRIKTYR